MWKYLEENNAINSTPELRLLGLRPYSWVCVMGGQHYELSRKCKLRQGRAGTRWCYMQKQLKDSVCGEKWNMNSTYIHRRVRRYVGTHMLICMYCTINHTVKLSLISLNSQTEEEKDSISFHILFCQMEVCRAPHTQPNGHKFSIFLPLEHSAHSLVAVQCQLQTGQSECIQREEVLREAIKPSMQRRIVENRNDTWKYWFALALCCSIM